MIDYENLKKAIAADDRIKEIIMDLIPEYYKIDELTQPEPKYKDAWYLDNQNRPECTKVLNKEGYIHCDESDITSLGRTKYPTEAALIEAQIEYWENQREEEYKKNVCEHDREKTDCFDCNKYYDHSGAKLDMREPTRVLVKNQSNMADFVGEIEPEFCDVLGVKLDKREPDHPRQYADSLVAFLCSQNLGTTGCQHESEHDFRYNKCTKCNKDYWQNCDESVAKKECEHEHNEHGYFLSDPIQFLCIKCGEFYR